MASIAFVVGNSGSLSAELDTPFKNRLETNGHTVTVIDDSAAESTDFSPYNLIVITGSVNRTSVDGLKSTTKPIWFCKRELGIDYDLGTGNGEDINETVTNIVDVSHYITEEESTGNLTVYSGSDYIGTVTGWSNDVVDLSQEAGSATEAEILVIGKNETLADSSTAAERRVFFGMSEGDRYTSDAWTLFDRAITWLLYNDDVYVAYVVADSTSLDAVRETPFKNRMETELGLNVVLVHDADCEYNLENCNMNAIFISSEVVTTQADGLSAETVPIGLHKSGICDSYGLESTENDGGDTSETQVNITNTDHFITKQESSGNLTIYTSADLIVFIQNIANDVISLAEHTSTTAHKYLVVCEKGDKLANGNTSAERRLFIGFRQGNDYNAAGWRLFDRAIVWLLHTAYVKNFTESITLSESLTKDVTKVFTEDITLSEGLTKEFTKVLTENITLSESLTKEFTKVFLEDITLSESFERVVAYVRNYSETITLSEELDAYLDRTLKEAIIDEIDSSYTVNTNQFDIVKKHGEVPVLTANLQDKVSLFYRWLIDYDFRGGVGHLIVYGFVLELELVCQLDDNTAYGVDKGMDILRAILDDMETNINSAISGYQAWYVDHSGIRDVTIPSDREKRVYRYKTSLSFYRNYGVTVG